MKFNFNPFKRKNQEKIKKMDNDILFSHMRFNDSKKLEDTKMECEHLYDLIEIDRQYDESGDKLVKAELKLFCKKCLLIKKQNYKED